MTVPCVAGRILTIDLTSRKIEEKPLPEEMIRRYLGSRGIAAKMLWDETDKDTSPLGPENVLIFSIGTLTGMQTTVPCSGRVTVTTRSPATNMYLKTSAGGHWGSKVKSAGYDILLVTGKAENPVYLLIDDQGVQFRDAAHLWGKDVRETNEKIQEELNDHRIDVACIGPAGENKVLFSAIMFSIYNAAGRGGAGAVMGAKKLKAIVARGDAHFKAADQDKFRRSVNRCRELIMNDSKYRGLAEFGTSGGLLAMNEDGICGTRNYREGSFEGARFLSGQYLIEAGYLKKRLACESCIIGCHRYTEWQGGFSGGPEFETLAALGCGLRIDDIEAVLKGNELCNIYGLDTISTGGVIQWAVESFERGVLTEKETDGILLNWGDGKLLVELIKKIAFREGIGGLLAEGSKKAAEKVGKGSYKWAVQARGLEQSRVDTRSAKSYALAFALNPRGPDHLHTECLAEFGRSREGIERIRKLTGSEKYASSHLTEKRPEIVRWHEDCYAATESLGLCVFITTLIYSFTPADMAELFSYATGISMDEEGLMKAGERIVTLEQCYNIKLGKTREWHVLPWRIMNDKSPMEAGSTNIKEELDDMLDKYFELRKWDKKTSFPYLKTLKSLGLEEIGNELKAMGILLP